MLYFRPMISTNERLRKQLRPFLTLGPLALSALLLVFGLAILTAFRLSLGAVHMSRLAETPGTWWLFPIGLRMDLMLLSYITLPPTVLLLVLPKRAVRRVAGAIAVWCTAAMAVVVYMEIATFPFMQEYDLRPDQKFWEYLKHYKEVGGTLLATHKLELVIAGVAVSLCAAFFWFVAKGILRDYPEWHTGTRVVAFPLVVGLSVLGARSSIGHRPANLSTASFSENHLANELALNSTYSALYAAYRLIRHERNPSLEYGKMGREEIFSRVRNQLYGSYAAADKVDDQPIPFLHDQDSPFALKRPMNVVVFLQESMGAVDVGCLEGPPITPNLCRLKDEGLWLSNLYATGTRTVRGIEATVSGFLPTSAPGVVKLGGAKKGFLTAASVFKQHGYATEFYYGGMSNFDEMRSFFLGNGFDEIYDEPTFENPAFHGTWGVSDEDLVRKANTEFAAHGDKPFFALLLSTSNHSPYEFPDGRIELHEQPKQTHWNAIKYADYAIGLFFELAKKEEYFKNTIFLVVADHNSHVKGNDLVPISKYRIPGLIIGPNVPARELSLLSSQIDLIPTILHFSGLDTTHPMIGRDLMTLPPEAPGRAFMQYADNNAYRVNDEVIILQPDEGPSQYVYRDNVLHPTALNPEMARDALAHAHLPWILYSERSYRLP